MLTVITLLLPLAWIIILYIEGEEMFVTKVFFIMSLITFFLKLLEM